MPLEALLLLLVALAVWFWLDSMDKRDLAVSAGKRAAEKSGLQFLDDTVAISHLWLARDSQGRSRLLRTYGFEVSDTGSDRLSCRITMLGSRITNIDIPPHRDSLL